MLTLVGLDEERFRPLGGFSTGMKQRAKLAQAIVHDPELVLLDEPTAGLDPEGRDEMLDLISRLGGFGINVVTSSHVLSDIERHLRLGGDARRRGRAPPGPAPRDAGPPTPSRSRCSTTPAPLLARLGAAGCIVEQDGHRLTVSAAHGDVSELIVEAVVATGMGIRRMGSRAQSLEDVFLQPTPERADGGPT